MESISRVTYTSTIYFINFAIFVWNAFFGIIDGLANVLVSFKEKGSEQAFHDIHAKLSFQPELAEPALFMSSPKAHTEIPADQTSSNNARNANDNSSSNQLTPTPSADLINTLNASYAAQPNFVNVDVVQTSNLAKSEDNEDSDSDSDEFHEAEMDAAFDDHSTDFVNALLQDQPTSPVVTLDKPKRKRKRTRKNKANKGETQDSAASSDADKKSPEPTAKVEKSPKKQATPVKPKEKSPKKKLPLPSPSKKGLSDPNAGKCDPNAVPRKFSHSVLRLRFSDEDITTDLIRPIRQPIGPSIGSNGFSSEYQRSRMARMTRA